MSTNGSNNAGRVVTWAVVAGVVAFVILKWLLSYGFWGALVLAVLIALLVGILLWIGFYREADDAGFASGSVPGAAASAETQQAPYSRAEPAPAAKPAERAEELGKEEEPVKAEEPAKQAPATDEAEARPEPSAAKASAAGGADDLKMIKGVGPAIEKKLHAAGITTFAQIAALTTDEIEKLDAELNFRGRIERDDWVGQARTLAAGGSTEFSDRVKKGDVY